jgi:hypothetical protein
MADDDEENDPEILEIDILQTELEKKLPHWLDPTQRYPEKFDQIRNRNRARWLAEQKKNRISGKRLK